jgi:anti-anti-sigma factor
LHPGSWLPTVKFMFHASFDEAQSLLTIRFTGRVDAAQVQECAERMRTLLADVQPGWRLLTDLSAMDSMDTACVPFVRESMKLCNSKGVSMVVRVIPDARKDIGYGLLTIFHYDASVHIAACETLEEARDLLSVD